MIYILDIENNIKTIHKLNSWDEAYQKYYGGFSSLSVRKGREYTIIKILQKDESIIEKYIQPHQNNSDTAGDITIGGKLVVGIKDFYTKSHWSEKERHHIRYMLVDINHINKFEDNQQNQILPIIENEFLNWYGYQPENIPLNTNKTLDILEYLLDERWVGTSSEYHIKWDVIKYDKNGNKLEKTWLPGLHTWIDIANIVYENHFVSADSIQGFVYVVNILHKILIPGTEAYCIHKGGYLKPQYDKIGNYWCIENNNEFGGVTILKMNMPKCIF